MTSNCTSLEFARKVGVAEVVDLAVGGAWADSNELKMNNRNAE